MLDGFPRTLDQADALDRMLAERGARVSGVLDIEVPADELVRRLAGRLVCREASHPYHVTDAPPAVPGVCDIDGSELYHRDDDREDVVRNRVDVFERETRPVREHYRALGTPDRDDRRRPRPRRGSRGRSRSRAVRALEAA